MQTYLIRYSSSKLEYRVVANSFFEALDKFQYQSKFGLQSINSIVIE